jgi:hypothetical protein
MLGDTPSTEDLLPAPSAVHKLHDAHEHAPPAYLPLVLAFLHTPRQWRQTPTLLL